ncbi:hypothetical protein EMPS_07651 [Entomortierella parvispora]|uniref:OPT superfamily oligopeptide transporter n=1 Tax=Entomortierella parvispora TaxID=205924 RepID=A0A9P3LYN1_9FUNG|nr:hypothetical protein EMPS_07651 [Entomortierella parvispora]
MSDKYEHEPEKAVDEKGLEAQTIEAIEEPEVENSKIEAVRLVVPVTDDPTLVAVTFRFWVISFLFSVIGSVIQQYYFYRSTSGSFSIFFVNLASYAIGKAMARTLPSTSVSLGGFSFSLNPGPFNIKEHCLIGIAVSTAAGAAYAIDILSATDLFLDHRIGALGSLLLIITTQCVGYGMAGVLRKYLVYPAEMVWWSNLVQVVFYNAMHKTDDFANQKMIRGWSYMKYFWVFCGGMFIWEFIPQWIAPTLVYFDWLCWINPFNKDFWAIFSSISGGGVLAMSFDWTSVGGATMYYPLAAQLCNYGGMIVNYWILLPIMWMTNALGTKTMGRPLTSRLFFENGTGFDIKTVLNSDFTVNDAAYNAGPQANMSPLYAIGFMTSFIALAGCVSHIICFHGKDLWRNWRQAIGGEDEDIHTKLMQVYPEVPQYWYAIFYLIMAGLSIMVCEVYDLQLPWWGLIISLVLGWLLTLPICAMTAITGFGPGLNVITELVCGYMLPGKPIANMVFKCYGYMAMYQCMNLLGDLKLGHYMKIPPRSMFIAQFWGTIVGGIFNYLTMILIIDSQREVLNGDKQDPSGLWTGQRVQTFWGSGLIYGALGPARMFALDGKYGFVYLGFLIGFVIPVILWGLSKKFPSIQWSKFNVAIIAGGMGAFPNGYVVGVLPSLIVALIFQYYIFRYHKGWWKKYVFILSAALDTGAAFTGLIIFLFLGGGISPKLSVTIPSWWANHYTDDGDNAPFLSIDRCGAARGAWTGGV